MSAKVVSVSRRWPRWRAYRQAERTSACPPRVGRIWEYRELTEVGVPVEDLEVGEADGRAPGDQRGGGALPFCRLGGRVGGWERPGAEGFEQPVGGGFDACLPGPVLRMRRAHRRVEARCLVDVGDGREVDAVVRPQRVAAVLEPLRLRVPTEDPSARYHAFGPAPGREDLDVAGRVRLRAVAAGPVGDPVAVDPLTRGGGKHHPARAGVDDHLKAGVEDPTVSPSLSTGAKRSMS